MSSNPPETAAYEDEFVVLDGAARTLTLKHYLLVRSTRVIPLAALRSVRRARDVVGRIGLRPQGLGLSGILWARDWSRGGAIVGPKDGYARSFVIEMEGASLRSGFSVEDPKRFLAVLEDLCPGVAEGEKALITDEAGGYET